MTTLDENNEYLWRNPSFQSMPEYIKKWIIASPNAVHDFSEFFRRDGDIKAVPDLGKPLYQPRETPIIEVDDEKWKNLFKYGPSVSGEAHMFSMLAHEIGHDRYNTKDVLFKGGSAEHYVQYRAGLEGHAIFNAFSIFKDLEGDPAFKSNASFNSTGYLNGIELGQMYSQWRSGELNDAAAVERITAKVADTPYSLSTPLTDKNNDGKLTHRDAYLRDYEQVIKQHPELAKLAELPQESIPNKAPRLRGPGSGRSAADEDAPDLSPRTPDGQYPLPGTS